MATVSKTTLAQYGFVKAGLWALKETLKSGIVFMLELFATERVIYAFVVDDEVKYVGACREQDFKTRMKDYQYQGAQERGGSTNKHVATRIKECLQAGQVVEILALKPDENLVFHNLAIDLVAGLEKPLISLCDPEWNREPRRTREKRMRQALPGLMRLTQKGDIESLRSVGLTDDQIRLLSESNGQWKASLEWSEGRSSADSLSS
jgi:hypothetical protein